MGLADVVIVMDADTVLVPAYVRVAEEHLLADPALQAVGGIFTGDEGSGLVGQLQRNEFTRYGRTIARRKGRRVTVLTGTGTAFRARALQAVAAGRGSLVPGTPGQVFDPTALTEDNELTMALRTLGAHMVSPRECVTITEVMPSWRHLWRQRLRWDRGALEDLGSYGLTVATTRYWLQQTALAYATVALNLYLLLVAIQWLATGRPMFGGAFWIVVLLVFLAERLVSVWRGGRRARWLAAPLVIELLYAELILVVFVRGLADSVLRRRTDWGHVDRSQLARHALTAPLLAALLLVAPADLWEPVVTDLTLATPWYQTLSTVVAVNTLVFLVLALVDLVPRREA